jgi:hypothetical protein
MAQLQSATIGSLQLEGETIINIQPYPLDTKQPPKWQFWRKTVTRYNMAIMTSTGRLFVVDPDMLTIVEKDNK